MTLWGAKDTRETAAVRVAGLTKPGEVREQSTIANLPQSATDAIPAPPEPATNANRVEVSRQAEKSADADETHGSSPGTSVQGATGSGRPVHSAEQADEEARHAVAPRARHAMSVALEELRAEEQRFTARIAEFEQKLADLSADRDEAAKLARSIEAYLANSEE